MMRVLHVIDTLNHGGAETMLASMAPRFRSRGVECEIVSLVDSSSPLAKKLCDQGVPVRYTSPLRLYSLRQIPALVPLLRGYDLVHVHLFPAQLWVALAAAAVKTPLVVTEHNTWNFHRRWWIRPIDQWTYSRYKRIACISEATAQNLAEWCPSTKNKLSLIPNGIPLEVFQGAEPAALPDVPAGLIRLVFTGRCETQKDHATVLRALSYLPEAYLLLIGGGPLRPQLEQMAKDLGVGDRVSFLGWRQDVASLLKASDIYVHSAHFEGFGIAACEAMAAGLPVVASDVPGLSQVVDGAGILFTPGDEKQLVRHLKDLIHSPERRREMARASLEKAKQFSIDVTVDRYIRMYKSVLQADTQ